MANKTNVTTGGISLPTILFLIFLVLKLTNSIDWSWWWVTSPLWLPFAIAVVLLIIFAIIYSILSNYS